MEIKHSLIFYKRLRKIIIHMFITFSIREFSSCGLWIGDTKWEWRSSTSFSLSSQLHVTKLCTQVIWDVILCTFSNFCKRRTYVSQKVKFRIYLHLFVLFWCFTHSYALDQYYKLSLNFNLADVIGSVLFLVMLQVANISWLFFPFYRHACITFQPTLIF